MATTINGLTYNISTRIGECGARKGNNKTLYFPFFLLGTCGDDRGVIIWNGVREHIIAPKKMNYAWFAILAKKLKENPFDWDWVSFCKNILKPNLEHIKEALGINDEKVDRLLTDGYVFLNNFNRSWEDEGEDLDGIEEGKDIGYYPNFKNFLEHDNLEY